MIAMESKQTASNTSFFKRITYTEGIYPDFKIDLIQNPSRFFAVPIIGILVKVVMLIPVLILLIFLGIWIFLAVVLINPFIVLITGKYWTHAHNFTVGYLRLSVKATCFLYGLTDKYPSFGFGNQDDLTLEIPLNSNPKKLYAVPLLGGLIRFILLIPYFIFENIIATAATIGVLILAWVYVLFKGKYPEGIFELARDSMRVNVSVAAYILGLSDRYPSFYISMKHDKIKLILIAIAIIFSGWSYSDDYSDKYSKQNTNNLPYQEDLPLDIEGFKFN